MIQLTERCQVNSSIQQRAKPVLPLVSVRTHLPIKEKYGWADTLDLIEYNRDEVTSLPLYAIGPNDQLVLKDKGMFVKEVHNIREGWKRYAFY